jgi:hypothetical protein
MLGKCFAHLRSQWTGVLALLLVLTTGSAYALSGHNTVFSDDIVNREVKTADLAVRSVIGNRIEVDAVKSGRVANDTLMSADVRDGALTGTDVGDGALTGTDVADEGLTGADLANQSVFGADLADNSLTGDDVVESTLGRVPSASVGGTGDWSAQTGCNPESQTYVDCGFARADIPEASKVLVIATIRGIGDPGTSGGTGFCRLASNQGGSLTQTETFQGTGDNTTLVAVIGPRAAGQEDFGIECNEFNNGIQYNRGNVVTLAIAPL